jgi:hypothetical protein
MLPKFVNIAHFFWAGENSQLEWDYKLGVLSINVIPGVIQSVYICMGNFKATKNFNTILTYFINL